MSYPFSNNINFRIARTTVIIVSIIPLETVYE